MAGHSEGDLVGEFCTQRKAKCDKHGEQYRAVNCVVPWEYQAHHVLCVASVTQYLSADTDITPIVEQTAWCINKKDNMLAMPTYMGTVYRLFAAWALLPGASGKPPFADIPVHGYDHNSKEGYKNEIDTEMKAMANRAKKSKAKHEETSATLLGELNTYQGRMKPALKKRGERGAGTYDEWIKVYSGEKAPDSDWYVPFSMANKGCIDPRTFPLARAKAIQDRVKQLVAALT
jgi:A nuclease family of the HNH/ENDO VII superfamily with conserved AHH